MTPRLVLVLALTSAILAGCGGSDDEEAAVLDAVEQSNVTFARGDYAATCSYYTARLQREMVAQAQVKRCEEVWAASEKFMRESLTPEQYDVVTSYHATSAEVDGDRATATYPEPPASIADVPGIADAGRTVKLRREDGRWRIDVLPVVTAQEGELSQ